MNMQPVNSSKIIAIGYNMSSEILRIQFPTGTYDYFGVPRYLYESLMGAFSKTRYYARFIKDYFSYSVVNA